MHDALYLRPAPEFEAWLVREGIFDEHGQPLLAAPHSLLGLKPLQKPS